MENTNTEANSAETTQDQGTTTEQTANTTEANDTTKDQADVGDATDTEQESKEESKTETFELQLPEGSLIEDKAEFAKLLKDGGESQEGFNKLNDFVNSLAEKSTALAKEADNKAWEATQAKWEDELKRDETFGKDYSGNKELALETAESIGLDKWLKETGFDKNPEVLRAMAKVGKERADAEIHLGGNTNGSNQKNRDGSTAFSFDLNKKQS